MVSDSIVGEVEHFDAGRGVAGSRNNATGLSYRKYRTQAWTSARGWSVAEVIGDRFVNHRFYENEQDALDDVAGQLKPTRVNIYGSWIEVVDLETGAVLASYEIPRRGKSDKWVVRAVRAVAALGYKLETVPSVAPGQVSILIGG